MRLHIIVFLFSCFVFYVAVCEVTLAERQGGVNTFFDIFLNENGETKPQMDTDEHRFEGSPAAMSDFLSFFHFR